MQTIFYNISQVIGVAIIHSMWQGLLIYLLLRVVLALSPRMSSAAKHNVAFVALASITVWFISTLTSEFNSYNWVNIKPDDADILPAFLGMPIHGHHATTYSARYYYTIEGFLPYITLVYIGGFLFNTTKLVWARKKITSIRQSMSIDVQLQLKVDEFVKLLDMKNNVQFGMSKLVDIPCMVGYFKPVVLLPFTLATYLSAEEIEIIILHELAHIKRNDYLVNLAQQAMSVLLFFNPFAQLIDRTISKERENSCDDIVIEATQKPLVYAHALLKVEQTRQHEWQLALAATGKKYHLLNRIERIMKTQKPIGNGRHILLAIVLLTASITGLAWLNPTIANGKISFNKIKPNIITGLFGDTTHKKATTKTTAHKPHTVAKNRVKVTTNLDYNDYYYEGDSKMKEFSDKMNRLGEEMNKYYSSADWKKYEANMEENSKKLDAYYSSADWKKYEADMEESSKKLDAYFSSDAWKKYQLDLEEQSKKIEAYYNSPQWKELTEKQEKMSEDFSKNWGETTETKGWSERMEKIGRDLERYYNTPEFKALDERLRKKYNIPADRSYGMSDDDRNDENYRKYQDELNQNVPQNIKDETKELKSLGLKMRDHFRSPEMEKQKQEMRQLSDSVRHMSQSGAIKETQEKMREISHQMRDYQNNPELKQLQDNMHKSSIAMRAYQNNPELKQLQENMRKASANMRVYQNNPQLKQLQVAMRQTSREMHEYMNSPAFKVHMEVLRNMNHNFNFNDDNEKPEKPEAPEKPETPEKPDTTKN